MATVPAVPSTRPDAEAKKQRISSEFDRVRKETFTESMLRTVADALSSDAPYGSNSANKIRNRVEDIADAVDEEKTSAGRAVVEARFAMGSDDSQYLSQAVAMLWAGDGGGGCASCRPLSSRRHAQRVGRGLVRAMEGVLQRKRKEATGAVWKTRPGGVAAAAARGALVVLDPAQPLRRRQGRGWDHRGQVRRGRRDGRRLRAGAADPRGRQHRRAAAVVTELLKAVHVVADPESNPARIVALRAAVARWSSAPRGPARHATLTSPWSPVGSRCGHRRRRPNQHRPAGVLPCVRPVWPARRRGRGAADARAVLHGGVGGGAAQRCAAVQRSSRGLQRGLAD